MRLWGWCHVSPCGVEAFTSSWIFEQCLHQCRRSTIHAASGTCTTCQRRPDYKTSLSLFPGLQFLLLPPVLHTASDQNWRRERPGNEARKLSGRTFQISHLIFALGNQLFGEKMCKSPLKFMHCMHVVHMHTHNNKNNTNSECLLHLLICISECSFTETGGISALVSACSRKTMHACILLEIQ